MHGWIEDDAGGGGGAPTGILGPYDTVPDAQAGLAAGAAGDRALVVGESGGNEYSGLLERGGASDQIFGFWDFSVGDVATPPMAEGAGFDTYWGNPTAFNADGLLIDPQSNVVFDLGGWVGHARQVIANVLISHSGGADTDRDYIAVGLATNADTIAACGGLVYWAGLYRMAIAQSTVDLTAKLAQTFDTTNGHTSLDAFPVGLPVSYSLRLRLTRRGTVALPRDEIEGGGSKGVDTLGAASNNANDIQGVSGSQLVERATAGKLMISHAWPSATVVLQNITFSGVKNG
jgi:hypothetical protein